MKKWLTIVGILFSCNSYAFSFDACVESSTWIGVVASTRDQPYEVLDNEIRQHLDGFNFMFPQKTFLKNFEDETYFFGELKKAYDSKKTPDELQTEYLNDCINQGKPKQET